MKHIKVLSHSNLERGETEDETERPESVLNPQGQDCETRTFVRRGECSSTCGTDAVRSVERVVEIVKPQTSLGNCNVNPGTTLIKLEPCNTIPCPTDPARFPDSLTFPKASGSGNRATTDPPTTKTIAPVYGISNEGSQFYLTILLSNSLADHYDRNS